MDLYDKLKPVFENYLKENGHRVTPERFIVLRAITLISEEFSVYDVLCYLTKPNGEQEVCRASLFNSFKMLESAKIIEWIPSKLSKYRINDNYLDSV